MTDEDVIKKFHKTVGVGNINGPYKRGNGKQFWTWTLSTKAEIKMVFQMFKPFLGQRRIAKFREILTY